MKINILIDTDSFNYFIQEEGEASSSKDVRQLISLGRLAVTDLQTKLDYMLQTAMTYEQAMEESLKKNEEAPEAKPLTATVEDIRLKKSTKRR